MRRRKRLTIARIAFALAVVAMVPVTAQAKPMPGPTYWVGESEPVAGKDEHALYETGPGATQVEIPYLSQGVGVSESELGIATSNSPDDRAFARGTSDEATQVVSGGESSIDVNPYAVTGFGLALLLVAGGMGLAIRHNRKTKLSPA